ncbi:MAG: alkaline phosphatase family protein [Candidatus Aminicenantes bacterium]|nr:alkaline phosphatase family protein [Candidatus Aminicenantes bacterium]
MKHKVLVCGLDSAPAEIVFEKKELFPNLAKLIDNGFYGEMRSCDPPITIPAWMVMVTGQDPGKLGLYGFRHRRGYSYNEMWIATYQSIREKTLWDYVGEAGGQSCVISVPPTYPPRPLQGHLISCFITPDASKEYTYPSSLKEEIQSLFSDYIFDVEFRTDDKEALLEGIYRMTKRRFEVIKYLLTHKPWNFFMFVEIGVDRIQHGFWKYMDQAHHLYEPGNPYESVIIDYYRYLDKEIGQLIDLTDKETAILVVSDHGAKRMKGAFCINEWLIDQGLLCVKKRPEKPTSPEKLEIDWSHTKAWAWGGYYARVFLNVEGREPQGIIPAQDYEKEREELIEKLSSIRGPKGEKWATKVIVPPDHFPIVNGEYPDLMVYFDDLFWRSAGTVGYENHYLLENDTGPDDAVHAQEGIYIFYDPLNPKREKRKIDILDVAPTILSYLEIPVPAEMRGQSLIS